MPSLYPRASHPRRRTSLVGVITASCVFTPRRTHTSSIISLNLDPAIPGTPSSRSHSSRVNRGGRRQVIQLIAVPPPAVRPWRTLNAKSFDVISPCRSSGDSVESPPLDPESAPGPCEHVRLPAFWGQPTESDRAPGEEEVEGGALDRAE